jgi:hypothetical protein
VFLSVSSIDVPVKPIDGGIRVRIVNGADESVNKVVLQ